MSTLLRAVGTDGAAITPPPRAPAPVSTVEAFSGALERNRDALIRDLREELVRAMQPLFDEVRSELRATIERVRREQATRDADLTDAFTELGRVQDALRVRVEADRAILRGVVEGLERVARRLPAPPG